MGADDGAGFPIFSPGLCQSTGDVIQRYTSYGALIGAGTVLVGGGAYVAGSAALTTILANPLAVNQAGIIAAEVAGVSGTASLVGGQIVRSVGVGTVALRSRDIIEAAARTIAARGKNYLISRLTPRELAAYNADPIRGSKFLGTVVQRETAFLLAQRFPGRFGSFGKGADFVDRTTGELIELTTGGQALTKGKYGSSFGLPDLDQVAIYDLPR